MTEDEYKTYVWTPLISFAFMEKEDIRIVRYTIKLNFVQKGFYDIYTNNNHSRILLYEI